MIHSTDNVEVVHAPPTAAFARTLPRGRGLGGARRSAPRRNIVGLDAITHQVRQHHRWGW
jgi:hypothetical protein